MVGRSFRAEHPPFETREHRSATGGPHVIFKWDDAHPVGNSSGDLPAGIQVKSKGGYFILPPSRRKGRAYEVFVDVDPITAPEWLYDILGGGDQPHVSNEELLADDIDKLAYAVSLLPNDFKGRQEWKEQFGIALWNATAGSDEGFAIFKEFSERWALRGDRPIGDTAHKVWYDELCRSPPGGIKNPAGAATIYWMVDKKHPGWRNEYQAKLLDDFGETVRAAHDDEVTWIDRGAQHDNKKDDRNKKDDDADKYTIAGGAYDFPSEATLEMWDFLYGRHLLRGEVSGTAAMGGIGKTTWSTSEALAVLRQDAARIGSPYAVACRSDQLGG